MAAKSARLAVTRVGKVNRLRERREKLLEALERNDREARKMQALAFAALPDGFAISLDHDEPWLVVDERGNVVPDSWTEVAA